jgi:hypothetical protein
MATPKIIGGYAWNALLANCKQRTTEIRKALTGITHATGGRNTLVLHHISKAALALSELQQHVDELEQITEESKL